MSEPHDLTVLYRGPDGALAGWHFDPTPAEALPQETFPASYKLQAGSETLALQHFAPAHTDSDIYVHFQKANVISMGDAFFNGMYPEVLVCAMSMIGPTKFSKPLNVACAYWEISSICPNCRGSLPDLPKRGGITRP
jgi:hypothetical protein